MSKWPFFEMTEVELGKWGLNSVIKDNKVP